MPRTRLASLELRHDLRWWLLGRAGVDAQEARDAGVWRHAIRVAAVLVDLNVLIWKAATESFPVWYNGISTDCIWPFDCSVEITGRESGQWPVLV